jgi:ADP-heptose:LPS heptosyltransferase
MNGTILLISLRGFGDAVILRGLVRKIVAADCYSEVHVLTIKKYSGLFDRDKRVNIHTVLNGLTTQSGLNIWNAINGYWTVSKMLRKYKFSLSVDITGDVRERLMACAIKSQKHIYPQWENGHPASVWIRLNWLYIPRFNHSCVVVKTVNIYDIHQEFFDAISKANRQPINKPNLETEICSLSVKRKIIALHPFAGLESKMWNWESWKDLIIRLHDRGFEVRIYCSPSEILELKSKIGADIYQIATVFSAASVSELEDSLVDVILSVCLDSFFAHLCHSNKIPIIMLNGSSNHLVWSPPATTSICNGLVCSDFPCYNKPVCLNDVKWKFKCIQTITVEQVMLTIEKTKGALLGIG